MDERGRSVAAINSNSFSPTSKQDFVGAGLPTLLDMIVGWRRVRIIQNHELVI